MQIKAEFPRGHDLLRIYIYIQEGLPVSTREVQAASILFFSLFVAGEAYVKCDT
jgi:hypothetical protein